MGIFLIAVWRSRKHLQNILGARVGPKSTRDEPMSPRMVVFALVSGIAFLTFFCLKAGMSLWAILVFFGLYFAFSTAVSRMRAELGSPMHDLHYTGPETRFMVAAVGTRSLGPTNLSMFSFFWFFTAHFRFAFRCLISLKASNSPQRQGFEAALCSLRFLLRCLSVSSRNFGHLYPSLTDSVLYTRCLACQSYTGLNRGRNCRNG